MFPAEKMKSALKLTATNMNTSVLINNDGAFQLEAMSYEAQFSPVFAVEIADIDNDGAIDIYLGGNFYGLKPEIGRHDSNHGGYFKGIGNGEFTFISERESGIKTQGQVRDASFVDNKLIIARNNLSVQAFELN